MIGGLPLGFAQPLVLLGLLSLPVLWWLLRLVPPRPRRQKLGPEKLLLDILPKEETPARTPWWLTLLRLTLAALLIIAAAGPLWNPPLATSQASAPLALLIDDGWAAAAHVGHARAHRRRPHRARRDRRPRRRDHPALRSRPRHLARNAGCRARAAAPDEAEAAHRRSHGGAARDHALRRRDAERRGALALRWRRRRAHERVRHRAWQGVAGQGRHRGGRRRAARACACRRRQCGELAHREGAARKPARQRHRPGARARSRRACRSAKRRSPSRATSARPRRASTCRSRSATTSRGWKSRPSAPPAWCNCSTSAGAAAPSA